ncbi:MAG: DNA-binding protein WhiA [Clostridia bacterium]|nr:DNA-binding protein WhiA [Clostridia bacterium]
MNFGDTIKKEILSKIIKENHCKKAFIAGIIRGTGALYEKDGELGLEFSVADEMTAMFITNVFRTLFRYEVREMSVSEDRLNKKDKFTLNISGERTIEILIELEILIERKGDIELNLDMYGQMTKRDCCLRAFIRGLFVAVGGCTIPQKKDTTTGYHLELVFSHYTPALKTSEKLAEHNVLTKITKRRDSYIVYIKSAEEIKDFIAFLPAPVAVLKLTDFMINRELKNRSNRQKNCDIANVNKQVEASARQLEAIEKISSTIGLETLKDDLRRTAVARKENPDLTLGELAEELKISKSCLNHRLRKLIVIAEEL